MSTRKHADTFVFSFGNLVQVPKKHVLADVPSYSELPKSDRLRKNKQRCCINLFKVIQFHSLSMF